MQSRSGLKSLIRLIGKQPVLLGLLIIGTIVQVCLTVYLPVLIGKAVDIVFLSNHQSLVIILKQMLVIILLNMVVQWCLSLLVNYLVYGIVENLRSQVYVKLHQLPLSYLDQQSVGDLTARFSSDSEQLTNGLLMVFNQFFIGALTILFTIFTMAGLDSFMMVLVVSLTPVSLIITRYIAKKSYAYYRKQSKNRGLQAQVLEESIRQLDVIQAFNAQEQFVDLFQSVNAQYATSSQQAIFTASTVQPMTRFINALIYALLAVMGAFRIIQGAFTVGTLMTFLNYASQYSKPFNDISSVLSELQSALACADRMFTILDLEFSVDKDKHKYLSIPDNVKGEILFEDVSFSYQRSQPLIEHLSIEIKAGQTVAIVGPTGAGKSTIINLLMRFYKLGSGKILLDGAPIDDYSYKEFREQFGMVLQETWLTSGTIHENIAYGHPNATREAVIEAAKAANADFFICQLPQGYDTVLVDAGQSLSQGQRQLIAIARVFVKLPKLLILDEATSSIDTRTEVLVQQAFATLMKGRTTFIIAHRLSTIQSADMILVMDGGRIVEQGNHKDLMLVKGVYYNMQMSLNMEED